MAVRSGYYKKIIVSAIKKGELAGYDRISEEFIFNAIEGDCQREATETIGYYAKIELISGFIKEMYWSKEKMQIHADKYSKAYSMKAAGQIKAGIIPQKDMWKYSSFWYKNFDDMALKTMIRQLIGKWGVLSQDLIEIYTKDNAVMNQDGTYEEIEIELADVSNSNDEEFAPEENNEESENGELSFDDL